MSTRSVVAVQAGDGWRGRYVHSDGYPSGVGVTLLKLVERDGLEQVIKTLTQDHYGWSHLSSTQPDITGIKPPTELDFGACGSPEFVAHQFSPKGSNGDGRFANVPGYGVAYTDTVLSGGHWGTHYQQATEDEWHTSESWTDSDCEWAYVLTSAGIHVYENNGSPGGKHYSKVVPYHPRGVDILNKIE